MYQSKTLHILISFFDNILMLIQCNSLILFYNKVTYLVNKVDVKTPTYIYKSLNTINIFFNLVQLNWICIIDNPRILS